MNWENIDIASQEEEKALSFEKSKQTNSDIHEQNERKRLVQLEKLRNKKHDEQKRSYIASVSQFGELLMNNSIDKITDDLMVDDCEIILINFAESPPTEFKSSPHGYISLLKGFRITQREVKETYVDLESATVLQICYCKIINEKEDREIMQFSFEIFSFREHQINKYRASFGSMSQSNDPENLFNPTKKEKMLAKVKEINYAWLDKPDLEKIAFLLHNSIEYKVWRWKDKKCFTFHKHNFAAEFRKTLEEDFEIKSIVPFDPTCEAQYILGSYVYYLEGKGEFAGKRYQWMSNCIYVFDRDLNIVKMNQHGEFYPEDETLIPFEVLSKEKMKQKIENFYKFTKEKNVSLFSSEEMNFSFDIWMFSSSDSFYIGRIKGFSEYKKLVEVSALKPDNFKLTKPIDMYLDIDDPIYDTAITFDCTTGIIDIQDSPNHGKVIDVYGMRKFSFENGKIAKIILFVFGIVESDSFLSGSTTSGLDIKNRQRFI